MEQDNFSTQQPVQPQPQQPKKNHKLLIIILALLIIISAAIGIYYYSISTNEDNLRNSALSQKNQNPTYEHNLEDQSPFMGGTIFGKYNYNVEYQGTNYSEDAISILAEERITEEESLKIEDALPGVFCGMKTVYAKFSKYENDVYEYDFCLTPLPKDGEELFSIIEELKTLQEFMEVRARPEINLEDLGISKAD